MYMNQVSTYGKLYDISPDANQEVNVHSFDISSVI